MQLQIGTHIYIVVHQNDDVMLNNRAKKISEPHFNLFIPLTWFDMTSDKTLWLIIGLISNRIFVAVLSSTIQLKILPDKLLLKVEFWIQFLMNRWKQKISLD